MKLNMNEKLECLGLTKYQAAALAVVVKEPGLRVKAIAEKARVPLTKVYAVLNDLELLQTVRQQRTRPKKYFADATERVLATLVAGHKKRLQEAEQCAAETLTAFELWRLDARREARVMLVENALKPAGANS